AGDRVALPDLLRLVLAQRVPEGVVELLRGQCDGLMTVQGALEDRPARLERRKRELEHTFDGRRVDRDTGCTEAAVEQDLREGPAEGVAHDDRRAVEITEDL